MGRGGGGVACEWLAEGVDSGGEDDVDDGDEDEGVSGRLVAEIIGTSGLGGNSREEAEKSSG